MKRGINLYYYYDQIGTYPRTLPPLTRGAAYPPVIEFACFRLHSWRKLKIYTIFLTAERERQME